MHFKSDLISFIKSLSRPSKVPRRDAYLFTWAWGYIFLATYWLYGGFYWGLVFIAVGFVSLIASISSSHHVKAFGFSLLTAVAILHAFSFVWPFPSLNVSMPRPMIIMWVTVAFTHVLVAGWPVHCLEHRHDEGDDRSAS